MTVSSVVLGSWNDAQLASTAGDGRSLIATVGSADDQSSRSTTIGGLSVIGISPPNGVNDADTTNEDTSKIIDVLANDTDADGDQLHITAVETTGTSGTVTNNGTNLTYNPNGMFEHLSTGQEDGDSFQYTVSDPWGNTDTADVSVTVTGLND